MGIRIHQLSASVANQIAAGEVIERPASVVKELLENALDAGATSISIDIGFGGLNQVKVSDNGQGIVADDLPLAIAAHATSKITHLNDLYSVTSMGFRGEALASIASVSQLSLHSKPAQQEHAMMLRVEHGAINLLPCARSQGTTVEVRNLFFNAPVRKKFLKTERIEYQAIEAVVKRFALSAPAVALTLKHNDKPMLALPAAICESSTVLRIKKLVGKTFVDSAVFLDVERAGMRLHGWISGHAYQRSQHDKQWIYINRRMVKDKLMNHAIKQAYEPLLHPGRYPACVLYLTMPTQEVDVNVHPTKHEVRFQQPRLVHDFISSQIVQALACVNSNPSLVDTYSVQTARPGSVCEANPPPYLSPFKHEIRTKKNQNGQSFHVLNRHFALVFLDETSPYLVDVVRLQQHKLESTLTNQLFPLVSRPLLVPVSYAIDKAAYPSIEAYQPHLANLGVQLDFSSDARVMIRTIPQLMPLLDIAQLVQHLSVANLDQAALLQLLVSCQLVDAQQLNEDDIAELSAYLQQQLATSSALQSVCVRMSLEKCQEFIHV